MFDTRSPRQCRLIQDGQVRLRDASTDIVMGRLGSEMHQLDVVMGELLEMDWLDSKMDQLGVVIGPLSKMDLLDIAMGKLNYEVDQLDIVHSSM
ncbi:hypothetical protein BSKO_06001 [Bryopsis sp. KO-2023]|nr:hypothetical protein BSKO_06001 [Bryopsis sp. KO-2023]